MSNRFSRTPAPLVLDPIPSRWLRVVHSGVILLAAFAVLRSRLDIFSQMLLLVAIAVYAWLNWRQSIPSRLCFDNGWRWRAGDAIEIPLVLEHSVVWPALILLRFRDPNHSRWHPRSVRTLTLLPDCLPRAQWRNLRVHLRYFARVDDADDQRAT